MLSLTQSHSLISMGPLTALAPVFMQHQGFDSPFRPYPVYLYTTDEVRDSFPSNW